MLDSFNKGASRAVVFTVPHAGRDYPVWLIDQLAVPVDRIVSLEDRMADLLVMEVVHAGWPVLVARQPRLMVDLNRAETDFQARSVSGARDTAARPSHRARGGLGLVPDRLGNAALWRHPLRTADLAARIVSMPPLPGSAPAQIVLGNRHGASAPRDITEMTAACFREAGLRVAINAPYAGAHMLERHGRPRQGISALQIEFDRRLYLDAALDGPGKGLPAMQKLLCILAARLEKVAGQQSFPLAAE